MSHVIEVNEAEFQQRVLEESKTRPVVVDFWAPWCGPCKALGPVLEAEAAAADGAFLLVKVNTDDNPGISQQMGIRGIPAVKAFIDGKIVDEFTGALPKAAVQEFLAKLKGGPEDDLAKEAIALVGRGEFAAADTKALAALELAPTHGAALIVRAQVAAGRGDVEDAEGFLAKAEGDVALQPAIDQLRSRLTILSLVKQATDEPALRQRLEQGPDPEASLGLAAYEVLAGQEAAAFERVLALVAKGGDTKERAHKLALAIISLADDERARELRKQLSMALF